MARKQVYKTRRRKCDRCLRVVTTTEKVTDRIFKGGGHLCGPCIIPSMMERKNQ